MFVKDILGGCQEQIELSGLFANELSAFLFFNEGHWEQEMSGGHLHVLLSLAFAEGCVKTPERL